MKNEALYNKTVGILVQAYFNDTLEHGNCYACAVGNLVAANCGFKFIVNPKEHRRQFEKLIWDKNKPIAWNNTHSVHLRRIFNDGTTNGQRIYCEHYTGESKRQIDSTGYTYKETAMIESAFENATFKGNEDLYMYEGLMAVIEVLDSIHENTDTVITETSKKKFNKQPQTA